MKIEEISVILAQLFNSDAIAHNDEDTWQVKSDRLNLLVILSENHSWLRLLTPIAPVSEAQVMFEQLLTANFESTGEVRYAIGQNVLWGVFYHRLESLTSEDLQSAITSLGTMAEAGLSESFQDLIEGRIRQIIYAAKLQNQSLETTLQTLERFYQEGMLGGLNQKPEEREQFLGAWKYQLKRLWSEVDANES
ncbi:hypothetical protein Sta7437_2166 [Stanieria cyanosphaera PCC 7437]|uniref:DNA-binding domain-containing protein n=1 Tax=Stanieria cyanosphaera (strain ATCC 29371 / PCC 7437) TaxID=111780 RepID=K9XSY4_STAC7|nr:type III secretion system chaperone [Stanieria cyanosphaera]AFZ35715.1 hypothetical protein Sta7437_2166 [Stanieria cyanosphaera PCC 7437]